MIEVHGRALLIKYLMTAVALTIVLPLVGTATLWASLLTAAVVTIVAYLSGDMLILPALGNGVATAADGFIAALTIWVMQFALRGLAVTFWGAIIVGAVLAVGEWFFHGYVRDTVLRRIG